MIKKRRRHTKTFYILILKGLKLINISVKFIIWQIFNETLENKDLNRNKDDYCKMYKLLNDLQLKIVENQDSYI